MKNTEIIPGFEKEREEIKKIFFKYFIENNDAVKSEFNKYIDLIILGLYKLGTDHTIGEKAISLTDGEKKIIVEMIKESLFNESNMSEKSKILLQDTGLML